MTSKNANIQKLMIGKYLSLYEYAFQNDNIIVLNGLIKSKFVYSFDILVEKKVLLTKFIHVMK